MEAKDRIVKTTEENYHNTLEERVAEQDRLSFKAGIKKVVEWIKTERKCKYISDVTYYPVYEKALEAQLKEWGIKEEQ